MAGLILPSSLWERTRLWRLIRPSPRRKLSHERLERRMRGSARVPAWAIGASKAEQAARRAFF
jgi:hypothetical protein